MSEVSDRNYVAAWHDFRTDKVIVLERDQESVLHKKIYNSPYYFYIPDEEGDRETIFGDVVSRAEFSSREQYRYAKDRFPVTFESDISPLSRVLMDRYYGHPVPPIHYCYIDIEVDYSSKIGWAGPKNPYAPINAITIYQSWTDSYLTYAVPPKGWHGSISTIEEKFDQLVADKKISGSVKPMFVICDDEHELMAHFLGDISSADIVSGWNSEFFDIPYICERLLILGGDSMLAMMDFDGTQLPRVEMVNHFGSEEPIYKFNGRNYLDYMRLYQKFTLEGHASYALGNILEEEVGFGKLGYDGTLEQLYNENFETFAIYNFRDVSGLVQLNDKLGYMELMNQVIHENTVLYNAILGTVTFVETGIINYAHNVLHKVVNNKTILDTKTVEGAIVLTPKPGMHEWIANVDLKSLYPNTIRSLNASPETIIGQFTAKEEAWSEIRKKTESRQTLILESGEQLIATSAEWNKLLREQKWAVSAYGTVFDQSKATGLVAGCIGYWYDDRKAAQIEKKKYGKLMRAEKDPEKKAQLERQHDHYDMAQATKKLQINSTYGALLSVCFRFGDERLGASTTATGRAITSHMMETVSEILTGERSPVVKKTEVNQKGIVENNYFSDSPAILYGDTDSCYFKLIGVADEQEAIEAADLVDQELNKTFPTFMREAFNCQPGFDDKISANREIVGRRGIWQAKKKYLIKVFNSEGVPCDKIKSMGSEIKKSDTPKIIQKFIKDTVYKILDGENYDKVAQFVIDQRKKIIKESDNLFELGISKQVNNLDKFEAEYKNPGSMKSPTGRALTIPGHVRAALNFNNMLEELKLGTKRISSGSKAVVFYLKPNTHNFTTIAFPAELEKFPSWFDEHFEIDKALTETRMFDNKLGSIFGTLGYEVPSPQTALTNSILSF